VISASATTSPMFRSPTPAIPFAIFTVALFGLLALLRAQGYLQFLELAAYDVMVATASRNAETAPPILLVEITERDIQTLGNWPLTDAQLHTALQRLLAAKPQVIGVDIYRDLPIPPGSEALDQLLREDQRIIVIEKFPGIDTPGIPPPPILQDTEQVGFSDLVSDAGGVIRRSLLFQASDERSGYSFALRIALRYLFSKGVYPQPGEPDPGFIRLGEVTLIPLEGNEGGYVHADAGGYQVMLDFIGGPDPFERITLGELSNGKVALEQLKDKILIIGVASESVKDRFVTPHAILGNATGDVSGTVLHAHAVRQLLDAGLHAHHPPQVWNDTEELLWLLLWTILGMLIGWFAGSTVRLIFFVSGGLLLLFLSAALTFQYGWWIPLVPPALAWMLAAAISTALLAGRRKREQQELMGLFARHVSPQIAETIWQHRDEVLEGGRIRPQVLTVTVLFTDLQGFTKVSAEMEPEPFLEWLNSYMAAMTDTIMRFGGVLDDYAGDGIKANFGVPVARLSEEQVATDARNAACCAKALGEVLNQLNRQWKQRGRPAVAIRIGIHTGSVVVGTVGSSARMKYTTVGSNVNLASRLESLRAVQEPCAEDERNSCRVLASGKTAKYLHQHFCLTSLGHFELRGIRNKTSVFLVGPLLDNPSNMEQEEQHESTP
jgi:adenylate cyclase